MIDQTSMVGYQRRRFDIGGRVILVCFASGVLLGAAPVRSPSRPVDSRLASMAWMIGRWTEEGTGRQLDCWILGIDTLAMVARAGAGVAPAGAWSGRRLVVAADPPRLIDVMSTTRRGGARPSVRPPSPASTVPHALPQVRALQGDVAFEQRSAGRYARISYRLLAADRLWVITETGADPRTASIVVHRYRRRSMGGRTTPPRGMLPWP